MNKYIYLLETLLLIFLFGCGKDNIELSDDIISTTEIITTEKEKTTTEAEIIEEPQFNEYYLLDYAVMAKLIAENSYKSNDDVSGCELYDSDNDGIPELYITEPLSEDTIFYGIESIFRINHYKKPQIMSLTDTSNNGSTDIFVSDTERKIYYYKTYGTFSIGISEEYNYWNDSNMVADIYYSYAYEEDERGEYIEAGKELEYKGEALEPGRWEEIQKSLKLRKLEDDFTELRPLIQRINLNL
ncbi:MAG: hypothetical protein IJ763_08925 [Lachnospiraceae bacterium]|nr:hypothetical protein [Lachnospiraceae bacterium]